MKRIALALAVVLAGLARAEDAAADLAALEAEVAASKLGYVEKWKAFKPKYEALAAKYPGTEADLSARLWLMGQTWWISMENRGKEGQEAMNAAAGALADGILKDFAESPRLAEIPLAYYVFSSAQREQIFTQLKEKSPHREVQAAGLFGLATMKTRTAPDEGRRLFAALKQDYGSLAYRATTYGTMADAYTNVHAQTALEVGRAAPEIEGVDHEGKPLRLSDFRGKVVLLDFWGDW